MTARAAGAIRQALARRRSIDCAFRVFDPRSARQRWKRCAQPLLRCT
jgi:hypothetical protein